MEIVTVLRQVEVAIANGKTTSEACRDAQDNPPGGRLDLIRPTYGRSQGQIDYDTRHMLTELDPKPEFVTVTTGSTLWDITSAFQPGDAKGTHLDDPKVAVARSPPSEQARNVVPRHRRGANCHAGSVT